jgi:RNA polymerase sigma factor for flagellar operon FliA
LSRAAFQEVLTDILESEDTMSGISTVPSPEQLALLSQAIQDVARVRRLSGADVDDFAQSVHVRFLERNYDIFDRFEGRSSMRTYLMVVVSRMLLDWRNALYGKWRPSNAAVRLGGHAIELERLMSRDGYSKDEAAEMLRTMKEGAPALCALQDLADQLPNRPRRRTVSDKALCDVEGRGFEDPVEADEGRKAERKMRTALAAALRQLSSDDRWLIRARYVQHRSVHAVAQSLQIDPKSLYRRYERLLRTLRTALAQTGIARPALTSRCGVRRPARGPVLSRTSA